MKPDPLVFRKELDDRRCPLAEDVRLARALQQQQHQQIGQCLQRLEEEWAELCESAKVWQNKVDNTLANLRIFEKEMRTFENG